MLKFKALFPFCNRRLLFISLFGFYSGLPLALSGSTLQAWLSEAQVSLMMMGIFSLTSVPYNFKFLWAPLLDRLPILGLGRRRGWILLAQGSLALCLFVLAALHPQAQLPQIAWLVLLMTFIAATQDIAIDAYRADSLLPNERGLGSAYFIFAYRMALFVSGGLALVLAHYWGWAHTYQLLGCSLLLGMIFTFLAPEDEAEQSKPVAGNFFLKPFRDLWQREHILWLLAFVILYKAGAALAVALQTHFLLHGLGFSLIEIGLASKTAIIIGTLMGAFVGGALMWRLGLYTALFWFGLIQAFSILLFLVLALVGKSFSVMVLTLFAENFCSGMSTAALMAFLMSLCRAEYSASQFAFLSAIDSLGRLVAGPLAAFLVGHYGWVILFASSFGLCLPALLILSIMSKKVSFDVPVLTYS